MTNRLNPYFEDVGLTIYCGKAEDICPRLQDVFGVIVMDCPFRFDVECFGRLFPDGSFSGKIITFSPLDVTVPAFGHPHVRPITEMLRLLNDAKGNVLDPYMGVGSTLIAAKILNRKVIGIDICEKYCRTAIERWKAA